MKENTMNSIKESKNIVKSVSKVNSALIKKNTNNHRADDIFESYPIHMDKFYECRWIKK